VVGSWYQHVPLFKQHIALLAQLLAHISLTPPPLTRHYAGDVRVFEGHAFIVEAAVSLGGRELKPGINVYRFANRIPLLFEGGSDVITRTATKRINWSSYKINQGSDRVSR
jgi:DNA topoisomerase VI subunit B